MQRVTLRLPTPSRSPLRRSTTSNLGGGSPSGGSPASPLSLKPESAKHSRERLQSSSFFPGSGAESLEGGQAFDPAIPAAARDSPAWSRFRVILSIAGLIAVLMGSSAAVLRSLADLRLAAPRPLPHAEPPRPPPVVSELTMAMLLEGEELHSVATDNLMRVGHKFLNPADRKMVAEVVSSSFKSMSRLLPEMDMTILEPEQKDAALAALRLLSDVRVQSIGVEVARAIRTSQEARPLLMRRSLLQQDIQREVGQRLRPRARELKQLHEELITPPLERLLDEHRWEMMAEPSNIRVATTVGAGWHFEAGGRSTPGPIRDLRDGQALAMRRLATGERHIWESPDMPDSAVGIMGGVLEEAHFLLGLVDAGSAPTVARFASTLGIASRLVVSCDVESGSKSLLGAVVCPLKFGSMGVGAL